MSVSFMAACNDYRNGLSLGKFEHSEIARNPYGCIAEFEHLATTVGEKNGQLCVGRLRVPYLNYTMWVGNWCWDQWQVTEKVAAQIINYLMQKRDARCIGGECELGDLLDAKQIIVADNLRERPAPPETEKS